MEKKYSKLIRILHWVSAFLILCLLISGFIMVEQKPSNFKWLLYANHKSVGIIIFVLFFIRVLIRIFSKIPDLPQENSISWRVLAKIGHLLLYALMLLVPLCGIAMSLYGGHDLSVFGVPLKFISIIKNIDRAKLFNLLHVNFAWLFIGAIGLHILGAIKHLVIDKINLFKRII